MFVSTMLSPFYFHHFLSLSVLFSLSPYPPITWIRCHTMGKWNRLRCIGKFIASVFSVTMFYCTCIYCIAIRFVISKMYLISQCFFLNHVLQVCDTWPRVWIHTSVSDHLFTIYIFAPDSSRDVRIVFQYMIQIDLFFWINKIFW